MTYRTIPPHIHYEVAHPARWTARFAIFSMVMFLAFFVSLIANLPMVGGICYGMAFISAICWIISNVLTDGLLTIRTWGDFHDALIGRRVRGPCGVCDDL